MAEGQTLGDAVGIRRIHLGGGTKPFTPLRAFALEQMAFARVRTEYFAPSGDFKPLGHCFLRFDTFWTSHNRFLKRTRNIRTLPARCKGNLRFIHNGAPESD